MSTLRDETLSDLLKALWHARLYMGICGFLGFVLAVLIIVFAVPHLRVVMVVAPALEAQSDGRTEVTLQHNGAPQETLPFQRYLQIISGPSVVRAALESDTTLREQIETAPRFNFQSPKTLTNIYDISGLLVRQLVVKPVGNTPLRIIEWEHTNPALAKKLLYQLHVTADDLLRAEHMAKTERRLSYLQDTLARTANPEHRQALTNLLMEQERFGMMLKMDQSFAAQLVEPPFIQPRPVWPRKSYIFPLCIMIGMMMGWVIFGIVKSYDQNSA